MNSRLNYIKRVLLVIVFLFSITATTISVNEQTFFISQVIDGDTLLLVNGDTVRLSGIDAPELNQPGYDLAKWFLFYLTKDKRVFLEKDLTDKDEFGRLMRFVFLKDDGKMVNELILLNGLADFRYLSLESKYFERLKEASLKAEANNSGLWAFSAFPPNRINEDDYSAKVIDWQDAPKYINEIVTAEGSIERAYDSGKACFLNFKENWSGTLNLVIFSELYYQYPANPAQYFLNKKIRVTGLVQLYKGTPQMIIKSPEQIKVIE